MKEPRNNFLSYDDLNAEAKHLGSIEELLKRAKEILETSILDINEPISVVNADVFIKEAEERLAQLTDPDEHNKYEEMIKEVDAIWQNKFEQATGKKYEEE